MRRLEPVMARFGWGIALLVLVAGVFSYVQPRLRVETDLLDLLPRASGDAGVEAAIDAFATRLSRKVIFLVGAQEAGAASAAAAAFAGRLAASGAFVDVRHEMGAGIAPAIDLYLAHRGTLLSRADEQRLAAGRADEVLQAARLAAYTPAGLLRPIDLRRDPLGLGSAWLLGQVPAIGRTQLRGSQLVVTEGAATYVLVTAETAGSPYGSAVQDRAARALAQAREAASAAAAGPVEVLQSGALQHATQATRTSQREVGLFGTLATVGVLALMLALFRDWRAPALGMLALTAGAAAGISATQLVFGELHLVALVFGSSLIGVAIDYSMHFYADQFRAPGTWRPPDALAHVTRPILYGAGATVLGYAGLLLLPFPGLQQMALISITGLAVACACVLLLFPVATRSAGRALPRWCARPLDAFAAFSPARWPARLRRFVAFAALAFVAFGLTRIDFEDDVRTLQMSTPALIGEERHVARLLGYAPESRFLLVSGPSAETVLQSAETLSDALHRLQVAGGLDSFMTVSHALPSLQRQRAAAALLGTQAYDAQGMLPTFMRELGFDEETITAEVAAAREANAPLTPAEWLASPASLALRDLWLGHPGERYATVVTLAGLRDVDAVRALATGIPGVRFVDRVGEISGVLGHYRVAVLRLLALAYASIFIVLAIRYRWRVASRLIAAPLGASLGTLALLGVVGLPVNLFTVLGLLLLLALGVDYAVFLREAAADRRTALLSVSLSAATTMLSCGLLAFSSTPLIASIGVTLAAGIFLCWLIAVTDGLRGDS
jgi:predicted exporter